MGEDLDDHPPLADAFDERQQLLDLAFGLLGTLCDAEEIVQETYANWYRMPLVERAAVVDSGQWVVEMATVLALEKIESQPRDTYLGSWLPEPILEPNADESPLAGEAVSSAYAAPVDMSLLVALERLSPAERVVFVLHEMFDTSVVDISRIVDANSQECQQLLSSARDVVDSGLRHQAAVNEHDALVTQLFRASRSRQMPALLGLLDPRAVAVVDGGGRVRAALGPIAGVRGVARLLLDALGESESLVGALETVGGRLGIVLRRHGAVAGVFTFQVMDSHIMNVWLVVNPRKLASWPRR